MEDVMKKMILLLVLAVMLTGCQTTQVPENIPSEIEQVDIEKTDEVEQPVDKTPVIRDEKAVIEAFDALAEDNVDPSKLNAFLMDHISNLGVDSANHALVSYLNQVMVYVGRSDSAIFSPAYQKLANETFEEFFRLDKLENTSDQGFIDLVETLYANGLLLESVDGVWVPVIDFERLFRNYGNEIGEDIKTYVQLVESTLRDRLSVNDKDSMNQVAKLIVEHDKYLKTFPNSMVRSEVESQRNWLRDVYYLANTQESYAQDSFNDVIQFYPGSELAMMTEKFSAMVDQSKNGSSSLFDPFVDFYDEVFSDSSVQLVEIQDGLGRKYPVLLGPEVDESVRVKTLAMLDELWYRYDAPEMIDWKIVQDYEIVYIDQDIISVVFKLDLVHPVFSNISINDMKGATFNILTGETLNLKNQLSVNEDSWTHVINDVRKFASVNDFRMSGIDAEWTDAFRTKDGLVLYRSGLYTGHNASKLLIPNEKITEWVE